MWNCSQATGPLGAQQLNAAWDGPASQTHALRRPAFFSQWPENTVCPSARPWPQMVRPGGLGGGHSRVPALRKRGVRPGLPHCHGTPCWPTATTPSSPSPVGSPLWPSPAGCPVGPSPCGAKGACSRGRLVWQKQPPLPLAWDSLFKQLCVELPLSVCLSPRLCPSRMKTYYPVGARAGHGGSTDGNDGLPAEFQEPSIPASSGNPGLLPSPLSAGPQWASVPAALMRVTSSEQLPCDRFRGESCVPPSLCPGGCTRLCVFISED
ncbi:unnamed protein product [Rangifer tarandus platyrhynchus]|uniref:Uncharacterized protein n=2 Tax=Rangifer tarandus platyrhynchus TaxID=3082113 RepID=A0ABN8XPF3_RANTA|nr:unnamed protein product [Rangifer tarandus platyrhynchus]CAI9711217.1 unnamed protein product [Rangifer tarandus platyrhynchus]